MKTLRNPLNQSPVSTPEELYEQFPITAADLDLDHDEALVFNAKLVDDPTAPIAAKYSPQIRADLVLLDGVYEAAVEAREVEEPGSCPTCESNSPWRCGCNEEGS